MATFKTSYTTILKDNESISIVKNELYDRFNENILGLGEIENKSHPMNAICAIFDLEGFTTFCKQIDPQLAVPEFMSDFLKWIFNQIKKELTEIKHEEGCQVYAAFPFLAKYLGDGLLFLWNTDDMGENEIANIVISAYEICQQYISDFYPKISKKIISPPNKLRCGIARGVVYSVGNGSDYVGPCINMASRLQKLNSLSVCFSRRGFNPEIMEPSYREIFTVKKVEIRGIGENELVCVIKREFEKLSKADQEAFKIV